jgi:peptidyl-prolyl cis-trans isomerase A (cyclophilin A)
MAHAHSLSAEPAILVVTGLGEIAITLHTQAAPHSCGYILDLVDRGVLSPSSVFRVVTAKNEASQGRRPSVEAAQFGLRCDDPETPQIILHEGTSSTGLRHLRGTVSLARYRPGAVYGSFFVCYRDEPCLDQGGQRNPDRQGFAAFGSVLSGWPTLEAIYSRAAESEYLAQPVPISLVRRKETPQLQRKGLA